MYKSTSAHVVYTYLMLEELTHDDEPKSLKLLSKTSNCKMAVDIIYGYIAYELNILPKEDYGQFKTYFASSSGYCYIR